MYILLFIFLISKYQQIKLVMQENEYNELILSDIKSLQLLNPQPLKYIQINIDLQSQSYQINKLPYKLDKYTHHLFCQICQYLSIVKSDNDKTEIQIYRSYKTQKQSQLQFRDIFETIYSTTIKNKYYKCNHEAHSYYKGTYLIISCNDHKNYLSSIIKFNLTDINRITYIEIPIAYYIPKSKQINQQIQSQTYQNLIFVYFTSQQPDDNKPYQINIYDMESVDIQQPIGQIKADSEQESKLGKQLINLQVLEPFQSQNYIHELYLSLLDRQKGIFIVQIKFNQFRYRNLNYMFRNDSYSCQSGPNLVYLQQVYDRKYNRMYLVSNRTINYFEYQGFFSLTFKSKYKVPSTKKMENIFAFEDYLAIQLLDRSRSISQIRMYDRLDIQFQQALVYYEIGNTIYPFRVYNTDINSRTKQPYIISFRKDSIVLIVLKQAKIAIQTKQLECQQKYYEQQFQIMKVDGSYNTSVINVDLYVLKQKQDAIYSLYPKYIYNIYNYDMSQFDLKHVFNYVLGHPYTVKNLHIDGLSKDQYTLQFQNDTVKKLYSEQFQNLSGNNRFWFRKYQGRRNYFKQDQQVDYLLFKKSSGNMLNYYSCQMDSFNLYLSNSELDCIESPMIDINVNDDFEIVDVKTDQYDKYYNNDVFTISIGFKKIYNDKEYNQCEIQFLAELDLILSNWIILTNQNFKYNSSLDCSQYIFLSKSNQYTNDTFLLFYIDQSYVLNILSFRQDYNSIQLIKHHKVLFPYQSEQNPGQTGSSKGQNLLVTKFLIEIKYELINIQYIYRTYVNIYVFCKKNRAIALIQYDCIADQYKVVYMDYVQQLQDYTIEIDDRDVNIVINQKEQKILVIVAKLDMVVEYSIAYQDRADQIIMKSTNQYQFPFKSHFGVEKLTVSQSENHFILSSFSSKLGFLFNLQDITDFRSDCIKIVNNMIFGTIDNFIGGQSLAIVYKSSEPKNRTSNQVLFFKLDQDQMLKVKEYPEQILRDKRFGLILTMQSLLDPQQTVNISVEFQIKDKYDGNDQISDGIVDHQLVDRIVSNDNRYLQNYYHYIQYSQNIKVVGKQKIKIQSTINQEYLINETLMKGNILRYNIQNAVQNQNNFYEIILNDFLDKEQYDCQVDQYIKDRYFEFYNQKVLNISNMVIKINKEQIFSREEYQVIFMNLICSISFNSTYAKNKCSQVCYQLNYVQPFQGCKEAFTIGSIRFIVCQSYLGYLSIFKLNEIMGFSYQFVYKLGFEKYDFMKILNKYVVFCEQLMIQILDFSSKIVQVVRELDLKQMVEIDNITGLQVKTGTENEMYIFIATDIDVYVIRLFGEQFQQNQYYDLEIQDVLSKYNIDNQFNECIFSDIQVERVQSNQFSMIVNSRLCDIYDFYLTMDSDQDSLSVNDSIKYKIKFNGVYQKQTGFYTPQKIGRVILATQQKVFRLVRDTKNTQETILMYQRLDYNNPSPNRISQSLTSTELFRYQSQFSIQISDFLYYNVAGQQHRNQEEFLIVLYGMSSLKIKINRHQSLMFQRQNLNRYKIERRNNEKQQDQDTVIKIQKELVAQNNIDYANVQFDIEFKIVNKKVEEESKKKVFWLVLAILFSICFVAFVSYIFYQHKKSKKVLNFIIQQQKHNVEDLSYHLSNSLMQNDTRNNVSQVDPNDQVEIQSNRN